MADQLAVTIRFKDLTAADATIAAKELISELQAVGISSSEISLGRSNADNQDLGTLVLVSAGSYLLDLLKDAGQEYIKSVAQGAGQQTGKQLVNWVLRKWQTRAELSCSDGRIIELGQAPSNAIPPRSPATSEAVASLKSAAVVVLGASKFPGYPADLKLDNVAFKQSADITKSLLSETNTVFKNVHVLDLFDAEVRPDEIVDKIEEHITRFSDVKDVIIYYCGHGDFLTDREKQFYLLLKSTRQGREVATGLKLRDFRIMLEQQAHLLNKRCYFIIDSCFSGAAVEAFQGSNIEGVLSSQVEELLPPTGMAFLTAADRKVPAIGNDGKGRTMFSGAFADVLNGNSGSYSQQQTLSLYDLKDKIAQRIKAVHGMAGVLPQCHAPQQVEGDVSKVPIFVPTPAQLSGLTIQKTAATGSLTSEEIRKAEELLSWDLVKNSSDIAALERHLARFPDGITKANAEKQLRHLNSGATVDIEANSHPVTQPPDLQTALESGNTTGSRVALLTIVILVILFVVGLFTFYRYPSSDVQGIHDDDSNKIICRRALSQADWSLEARDALFVAEAKRRGLTTAMCIWYAK